MGGVQVRMGRLSQIHRLSYVLIMSNAADDALMVDQGLYNSVDVV